MDKIIEYLRANNAKFVDRLSEAVKIASISGSIPHRPECIRQMHEGEKMLKARFQIFIHTLYLQKKIIFFSIWKGGLRKNSDKIAKAISHYKL